MLISNKNGRSHLSDGGCRTRIAGRNLSSKTKPPEVTTEPLFMKQPVVVEEDNFEPPVRIEHKREMANFGDIAPKHEAVVRRWVI
jgi:hypothetical protein